MTRYAYRPLVFCSMVFVAGNVLHTADHLRRGWGLPLFGVTPEVLTGGLLISPDALAWIVVSVEIAGGLMTGLAGLAAWRRDRGDLAARAA